MHIDGFRVENGIMHLRYRGPVKCLAPSRHLVQHEAEGEQIGSHVQLLTAHLLRGHVSRGANCRPGTGKVQGNGVLASLRLFVRSSLRLIKALRLLQLGQAEVENLGAALGSYKNVRWLDVAMDDVLLMRDFQTLGDLNSDIEKCLNLKLRVLCAAFTGEDRRSAISSRRVRPSSSSITMKGRSWCSSTA